MPQHELLWAPAWPLQGVWVGKNQVGRLLKASEKHAPLKKTLVGRLAIGAVLCVCVCVCLGVVVCVCVFVCVPYDGGVMQCFCCVCWLSHILCVVCGVWCVEWGGMECGGGVQWCGGTKNPEKQIGDSAPFREWMCNGVEGRTIPRTIGDSAPFREWKGLLVSLKRVAWRMPLRPFGRRGTADAPVPFRAQGHHQTGLTRAESPEASI